MSIEVKSSAMRLVELILQGVKGFPPQCRLALASGQTFIRAASAGSIRSALEALFFPERPSDGLDLEDPSSPACRVAVVFQSADGKHWRVARDLRGASSLQRHDPAAGKFRAISADPGEFGPYLRTQGGIPPHASFLELFTLGVADFPSARELVAAMPEASADLPPFAWEEPAHQPAQAILEGARGFADPQAAASARAGLQPPRAAARGITSAFDAMTAEGALAFTSAAPTQTIPELERELAAAREAEGLQDRIDGLRGELDEVEERGKELERIEAELAAASGELQAFEVEPAIPAEIDGLLARFREATSKKEERLQRLEEERAALEEAIEGPAPPQVWTLPGFQVGCALGALSFAAALLSPWRGLALLAIPSFGYSALLSLQMIGALQQRERAGRRQLLFDERERKALQEWEGEGQAVRLAMKAAKVESVEELERWLAARERAGERKREALQDKERLEADESFLEELRVAEELRREVAALEDQLGSLGAAAYRSAAEIAQELETLQSGGAVPSEASLGSMASFGDGSLLGRDGAVGALGTDGAMGALGAAALGPTSEGAPAPAPPLDHSTRLLAQIEELLLLDREGLLAAMGGRASQYLAALSGNRFRELRWRGRGGLSCVGEQGEVPFYELAPRHQDLAWLSLRFTVIEQYSKRYRLPLVLDDPFHHLSEQRQALVARMLEGIAGRTQVLHRTSLEAMVGEGQWAEPA